MPRRSGQVHGETEGLFLRSCNTGCLLILLLVSGIAIAGAYGVWASQQPKSKPVGPTVAPGQSTTPVQASNPAPVQPARPLLLPVPDDGSVEYGRLVLEHDRFEARTTIKASFPATTVDGKLGAIEARTSFEGKQWPSANPPSVRIYMRDFDPYEMMAGGFNIILTTDGVAERLTPETSSSNRFAYLEITDFDAVLAADQVELKCGMLIFDFDAEVRSLLKELRQAIADSQI